MCNDGILVVITGQDVPFMRMHRAEHPELRGIHSFKPVYQIRGCPDSVT